jgi:hypothetical protein
MKAQRGVAVWLYYFFSLGVRWGTAVNAMPRPLYLRGKRHGAHFTGGWVGPMTGLDTYGKSGPQRDSIPWPFGQSQEVDVGITNRRKVVQIFFSVSHFRIHLKWTSVTLLIERARCEILRKIIIILHRTVTRKVIIWPTPTVKACKHI